MSIVLFALFAVLACWYGYEAYVDYKTNNTLTVDGKIAALLSTSFTLQVLSYFVASVVINLGSMVAAIAALYLIISRAMDESDNKLKTAALYIGVLVIAMIILSFL